MVTDLKAAYDHPANLLRRVSARWRQRDLDQSAGYSRSADALAIYEKNNDVTFAALDNGTLATIREQFNAARDVDLPMDVRNEAAEDVLRAVTDLLGLGD